MQAFKILEHTFVELADKTDLIIVDLGSNRGEFYKATVNKFGDNIKKYIGVEPNRTLYNDSLKFFNNDKATFYNKAISSTNDADVDFYEFKAHHECGNIIGGEFLNWGEHADRYTVKTITLESIIKTNSLTKIDLLKIDIEGAEYALIDTFTMSEMSIIKQVSIEFHDFIDPNLRDKTKEYIEKIKSFGFILVAAGGLIFRHNTNYADCLFVNTRAK